MAPIMASIPNIFKATSMSLLFVSTAAKLRSLDSKRSWASLPTKTPFRCGFYLNLHQMDKHMEPKELRAKLNGILHDIAAGRTCEQILASDRTLSYHHIFHAVAEAPTSFWDSTPADSPNTRGS